MLWVIGIVFPCVCVIGRLRWSSSHTTTLHVRFLMLPFRDTSDTVCSVDRRRSGKHPAGSARERGAIRRDGRGRDFAQARADCRRDGRFAGVAVRATVLSARRGEGDVRHGHERAAEHRRPVARLRKRGAVTALAWVWRGKPTYAFEGIINFSAATIEWLKNQLGLIRDASEVEKLATSIAGQRRRLSRAGVCGIERAVLVAGRAGGHRRHDGASRAKSTSSARRRKPSRIRSATCWT